MIPKNKKKKNNNNNNNQGVFLELLVAAKKQKKIIVFAKNGDEWSKFNFKLFWKKIKFWGFHVVVLVKNFLLMYQLPM